MEIIAQKREKFRKQVKDLKDTREIPAVMFGKGLESESITIGAHAFAKVFKGAGETSLVDLVIDGKKEKVLIKEVQYHPVTSAILHVSFHKVNLKEKITAQIPVKIIGEETNPLIKNGEGIVLTLINEITVEALPTDLPHSFEIDVAALTLGESVTISQLNFDKTKVKVTGNHSEDDFVVKMDKAGMEEEAAEEVSEEEAIAGVKATEELSEEEKAKRAEEKKDKE